ncbi:unnamed protein product [Soboliphyme baturini]|uniref:Ovule protein n=1 Tax=Soboliphyme baturini TaxID=241478 RepID=A0A183IGL8_9BILA|nr:unnamed protein product [Soboliphyme baturini]
MAVSSFKVPNLSNIRSEKTLMCINLLMVEPQQINRALPLNQRPLTKIVNNLSGVSCPTINTGVNDQRSSEIIMLLCYLT